MLNLVLGLFIGILLSIISVLVGKKFSSEINSDRTGFEGKAKIIRIKDEVDSFLE